MAAHWVLCNVGSHDRIQSLVYAIQESGRTSEVLSIKECFEITETNNPETKCNIFRGSINMSTYLKESRPGWIGNWHSRSQYLCSRYYSYLGQHITQREYIMLSVGEVLRKWDWIFDTFAVNDKLFIRPNSGEKEFNGEIVHRKNKESWQVLCVDMRPTPQDEICVISKPVQIEREIRLIAANKKIITGSVYREHGTILHMTLESQPDQQQIIEFAEQRLTEISLPPVHCIDIAFTDQGMSVLEVGCFCCCGLYLCDLHKIATHVSEAAEQWNEKQ